MRLLLAEDERSLSKAIVTILEKNNYSADAVYDGVEALEYLESGNYDGLILDIMMPRMDGLTVLKKLREKGNTIPVLMLTGCLALPLMLKKKSGRAAGVPRTEM